MTPRRASAALPLLGVLLWCLSPPAHARGTEAPREAPSAPPAAPAGRPFPAPLLHTAELTYAFLLYHPTPPPADGVDKARKLVAAKYPELFPVMSGKPQAEVEVRALPAEDVHPIPERLLSFFARRLTPAERQRLRGARHITRLVFHVPFVQRHEALLAANRLAHQLAAEQGAFLWDDETREFFTAARWKEERLEGWKAGPPTVSAHITVHVYGEGDAVRFVSLGMVKLGLPDLVVEQVPQSLTRPMGTVLNGVAQLLAEGLTLSGDGSLKVDLGRVKDGRTRTQLDVKTTVSAERKLTLRALEARRDSGDPVNPLLELDFPGEGAPPARQIAALDTLLGKSPDTFVPVPPGDPELAAVATQARARLQQLRPRIEKGLAPPEALVVKAAFPTDDGSSEHMWFVVTGWEQERLRGTLANEPFEVSGLRLGSSVSVLLQDVDDFRYTRPDGKEEGGESSRILERRQGSR